MLRIFFIVLASMFVGKACGQVNRCEVAGAIVYQDAPCPGAKFKRVDRAADVPSEMPPSRAGAGPNAAANASDSLKARLAVYERERHLRESKQKINDLQAAVAARNAQMERELTALRDKKSRAANNLAGAQWEQSISSEMSAVTEKYRALNGADLQEIAALRGQIVDLQLQ